jgi:2-iminobutanoate/2-iminopropanoate deaminase
MSERRVIQTAEAPAAIGPYKQAVLVDGWLWCSGQIGLDPRKMEIVPGGVVAEAKQVLENLGAVLRAAGLDYRAVVKTTIFLADMADFAKVNEVYAGFFGDTPPARSTVAAAALPKGARVEIDCVARAR